MKWAMWLRLWAMILLIWCYEKAPGVLASPWEMVGSCLWVISWKSSMVKAMAKSKELQLEVYPPQGYDYLHKEWAHILLMKTS